ncbi:MAG: diaminopimelate dehydrogenase [Clostridia bacterium]|nr:diaminopimelate dehydrogenase [Clostridia bacterium]
MIKVGIVGYGNLGKGVSLAVSASPDLECVGIFTRRNPESVKPLIDVSVYPVEKLADFKNKVDVMILCGGSATDLPETTANVLKDFNTVDSFDTHARIPEYFAKLDKVAKENGKLGAISIGWDPGLFSVARLLFSSVLPDGNDYTFWGKGVSQGHSDAIRRIKGVKNAIQYTIPKEDALTAVRSGENPTLSARQKHLRECFVVAEVGADKSFIEKSIKEMPNYFSDYDTIVHFVSEEELKKDHSALPHGGFVLRSGKTSDNVNHILELSLKLDSNPQFTGSVLTAYARAVAKMAKEGKTGAITVFDVPLKYLSAKPYEELIGHLL